MYPRGHILLFVPFVGEILQQYATSGNKQQHRATYCNMSSNIQIQRICIFCGNEFTARTTVTQCCSDTCAKKAYKARMKAAKIEVSNKKTIQTKSIPAQNIVAINSKDFLTIAEACQLLTVSRWTLWRLIKAGHLSTGKLGRLTRIKRSDIEGMFVQEIKQALEPGKEKEPLLISECYNISEVQNKFSISETALYTLIKRNNIDKLKIGKFVYVPKTEIEKYLGIPKTLFD